MKYGLVFFVQPIANCMKYYNIQSVTDFYFFYPTFVSLASVFFVRLNFNWQHGAL